MTMPTELVFTHHVRLSFTLGVTFAKSSRLLLLDYYFLTTALLSRKQFREEKSREMFLVMHLWLYPHFLTISRHVLSLCTQKYLSCLSSSSWFSWWSSMRVIMSGNDAHVDDDDHWRETSVLPFVSLESLTSSSSELVIEVRNRVYSFLCFHFPSNCLLNCCCLIFLRDFLQEVVRHVFTRRKWIPFHWNIQHPKCAFKSLQVNMQCEWTGSSLFPQDLKTLMEKLFLLLVVKTCSLSIRMFLEKNRIRIRGWLEERPRRCAKKYPCVSEKKKQNKKACQEFVKARQEEPSWCSASSLSRSLLMLFSRIWTCSSSRNIFSSNPRNLAVFFTQRTHNVEEKMRADSDVQES